MPLNAFIGKPEKPGDAELSEVLGPSRALWDRLLNDLSGAGLITGQEWHAYSVKAGWSLRLQRKERNIVYMVPGKGVFQAAFVFGDKALGAIRGAKFPKRVLDLLCKKYPEGTPLRLDVRNSTDVGVVEKLVAIKVAN